MNWAKSKEISSTPSNSNGSQPSPVGHDRTMDQPSWTNTALAHSPISTPNSYNHQQMEGDSYYTASSSSGYHPSSSSYRARTSSTDSSFISYNQRHDDSSVMYATPVAQQQYATYPMKLGGLCAPDLSPSSEPVPGRMPIDSNHYGEYGNFQSSPGSTTTGVASDWSDGGSQRTPTTKKSNEDVEEGKTSADIRREKIAIAKSKKLMNKIIPAAVYVDANDEVEECKKSIDIRRQKRAHAEALHLLNKTVGKMDIETNTNEKGKDEFLFRSPQESTGSDNNGTSTNDIILGGNIMTITQVNTLREYEQKKTEEKDYQRSLMLEKDRVRKAITNAHLDKISERLNPKLAETTRVVKPKQKSKSDYYDEDDDIFNTETISSMKCKMYLQQEEEAKQRALRLLAFSDLA